MCVCVCVCVCVYVCVCVCSGYGIAFDEKHDSNFCNDFARNAVIFRIDNILSSHTRNFKTNFNILDERDTFGAPEF